MSLSTFGQFPTERRIASSTPSIATESSSIVARLHSVMVGSFLGGTALSLATPTERLLFHPGLYATPTDLLQHLAWSYLTCSLGSLLAYSTFWMLFILPVRLARKAAMRILALMGATCALVAAAVFYYLVLAKAERWRFPAGAAGLVTTVVLGVFVGAVALPLVAKVIRRWPLAVSTAMLLFIGVVLKIDLHRYLRLYGNVHLAIGLGLLILSGFLGAQLVLRAPNLLVRATPILGAAIWLASAGVVLFSRPSAQARMAVLRYGGVEKSLIRHVLWPALDRDGDGFSRYLWGPDCNDGDPRINPLALPPSSPFVGCNLQGPGPRPSTQEPITNAPAHKARNLIWIVVDTIRSDVSAKHLTSFEGFVRFPQYRSCGGSTLDFTFGIFGRRGCPTPESGSALIPELKTAGYELASFISYEIPKVADNEYSDIFEHFGAHFEGKHDSDLLRDAVEWIRTRNERRTPFFAFIHLWGAHLPMAGRGNPRLAPRSDTGANARNDYDAATQEALRLVSSFVQALNRDELVVIMGDHGEEFGDHDGTTHGQSLYEEILDTPLLMRGMDFSGDATKCHMSCAELRTIVARSMKGLTSSESVCRRNAPGGLAAANHPVSGRGPWATHIRSLYLENGLKVIWNLHSDVWELYDLNRDPTEKSNLASSRPDLLTSAAAALFAEISRCSS